jgi:hypothetical protein
MTEKQKTAGEQMFHEIKTVEQGRNYICQLVTQVTEARRQCDVVFPGDELSTVEFQKKAFNNLSVRYGQALGALTTLMHCRVINDFAYNELRKQINAAMAPTVVGVSHS